jgi:hypothetical protein
MESNTTENKRQLTPEENAMSTRPMTLGEQRCHIDFNPSSELIESSDPEAKRCFSIAMTELETAQMYAVKGIAKGLKK